MDQKKPPQAGNPPRSALWYFVRSVFSYLFNAAWWSRRNYDVPPPSHDIPVDFCGVCVATSSDAPCDQYVIDSLRKLGIRHVRVDYSYTSPNSQTPRLLRSLIDSGFDVLLHLVQPRDEARAMEQPAARERWRDFVVSTLDAWGSQVHLVEIGSTVNRRRWAGYSLPGLLHCWDIAITEIRQRGLTLAGPNISDFEPLYTVALLDLFRQRGQLPDLYTNNLFVERVTEPEAFDHRIYGKALARLSRFNLVRKARLLQLISSNRGVPQMLCTYVSWTLPRIRRYLPEAETKQADYLTRYLLLAAASGAFRRVYWGGTDQQSRRVDR